MIMVTDTSGSMLAKDVRPDRLTAAREAARTLTRQVPEDFRLGLIKFGSQRRAGRRADDRPRRGWSSRCASCRVAGATAMGDGLELGLEAAQTPIPDGLGGTRKLPTAIVLLSDGASTRGEDPIDIAQQAKRAEDPHLHGRARHAERHARDHAPGRHDAHARTCRRTR